jgi:hypothetical protein
MSLRVVAWSKDCSSRPQGHLSKHRGVSCPHTAPWLRGHGGPLQGWPLPQGVAPPTGCSLQGRGLPRNSSPSSPRLLVPPRKQQNPPPTFHKKTHCKTKPSAQSTRSPKEEELSHLLISEAPGPAPCPVGAPKTLPVPYPMGMWTGDFTPAPPTSLPCLRSTLCLSTPGRMPCGCVLCQYTPRHTP